MVLKWSQNVIFVINVHLLFRKGYYSLNGQIVGGMDRRIYDILLSAPGSYHDAAVYQLSEVKAWLETTFPLRYLHCKKVIDSELLHIIR